MTLAKRKTDGKKELKNTGEWCQASLPAVRDSFANNAGFCPVNISSNYRIVVLVALIEIVIFIFNYYDDYYFFIMIVLVFLIKVLGF